MASERLARPLWEHSRLTSIPQLAFKTTQIPSNIETATLLIEVHWGVLVSAEVHKRGEMAQ